MPGRVLIISPSLEFRMFLEQALEEASDSIVLESLDFYPPAAEIKDAMGRNPPAAVIVGFAEPAGALATIRLFRRESAGIHILAAHHERDEALAVEAIRAGADAFFAPPFDLEALRVMAFGTVPTADDGLLPGDGKMLAFVPARGGDGASTLALHVAQVLSEQQGSAAGRTLLIDLDFHAGVSAFRLKLQRGGSILDALRSVRALSTTWRALPSRWKSLDVLAAPDPGPNPPPELFDGVPDFCAFIRRAYRYVVVDMPPALYASSRDVIRLSDMTFVVHTPEPVSRAHADRRSTEILHLGVAPQRLLGILNRADSKTPRIAEDEARERGMRQFATVRNDYAALQGAELVGRLAPSGSRLGKDVKALAERILSQL